MPWRLLISLHKRRLPRPRVAAEMDEQRVCARPRSVPLVIARLWTARLPGKAQPEQMRDRAKDPLSLARSQRKLAQISRNPGSRDWPQPPQIPCKQAKVRGSARLDRTQEVAGSSPASSTPRTPATAGVLAFGRPIGASGFWLREP